MKSILLSLLILCIVTAQQVNPAIQSNAQAARRRRCPDLCICNRNNQCISCKNDRYNDPRTNCTVCLPGYTQGANRCIKVNNSCPTGCICNGFVPGCASCRQPNYDPATNCTTCVTGFTLVYGDCIPERTCHPRCRCTGFVGWVCTGCADFHKTTESNCTQCEQNYTIGANGNCTWAVAWCPENCICNGFVAGCASCKTPNFDVRRNCTQCLPGYQYFESTMYGTKECRPICKRGCVCNTPNTCNACIDTLADFATSCTTCKPPYRRNAQGYCGI